MHRTIAHTSVVQAFAFRDMPLLDEEFDQEILIEDPEMLLEAPSHSINFVGESDEF